MARFPVTLGDKTVEIREFSDGEDLIMVINDRHYRVYKGNENHYFMLKVGGMQRSINGPVEKLRELIAAVHIAYSQYEYQVRRSKEKAQRMRDKVLNDLAEAAK